MSVVSIHSRICGVFRCYRSCLFKLKNVHDTRKKTYKILVPNHRRDSVVPHAIACTPLFLSSSCQFFLLKVYITEKFRVTIYLFKKRFVFEMVISLMLYEKELQVTVPGSSGKVNFTPLTDDTGSTYQMPILYFLIVEPIPIS